LDTKNAHTQYSFAKYSDRLTKMVQTMVKNGYNRGEPVINDDEATKGAHCIFMYRCDTKTGL